LVGVDSSRNPEGSNPGAVSVAAGVAAAAGDTASNAARRGARGTCIGMSSGVRKRQWNAEFVKCVSPAM
jgi:hypothetical protein